MNEREAQASDFYNEGMKNREAGFIELAISCFDKAIDLASNNFRFYVQRGFSKRDLSQFHEALTDFDQAIRLCNQQNHLCHHSLPLRIVHGVIVYQMKRNPEN